ncbi:ScbR family autoregulator-binding transcription factor [Streptomyces sp. NPDC052225]|uniref:ScbR family autoregulator-binding transcription factor n=1 Tax=Streptomyces sp. NPDC052225 TaxID=3154949 RepID=UPI00343A99DC
MAKQERGARSRQAILEAAAEVFDLHGYDAASTNEILARSGLTRGALYHHFRSKESIATALFEAHSGALAAPERPTRLQSIIDLSYAFAAQLRCDPVLRASVRLAVEKTSFPRPANTPYEQSMEAIQGLLAQAQNHGEILPGIDLDDATTVILGSFTGLQVMSHVYTDREDLPERLSAMWRFLLPGIASPGLIGHLRVGPPPASLLATDQARAEAAVQTGDRA